MTSSAPRSESDLLMALASAPTIVEQRVIAAQLEEVRAEARAKTEHLRVSVLDAPFMTPVDSRQTLGQRQAASSASDWLADIEVPVVDRSDMENTMRAEATVWLDRRPVEVRQDGAEFRTQAASKARYLSNRYPGQREAAEAAFLDQIKVLAVEDYARPGDDDVTVPDAETHETVEFDDQGEPKADPEAQTDASDTPSLAEGDQPQGDSPMTGGDHGPMSEGEVVARRKQATDGVPASTCSVCGEGIEQEKDGSWSHNVGNDEIDHEAKPVDGAWPESSRRAASRKTAARDCKWTYNGEEDGTHWWDCETHDKQEMGGPPGDEPSFPCEGWVDENSAERGPYTGSRKTAISLTNVGKTDDPLVFTGKNPSGETVKFRVTQKESDDLKAVLYSDLAMNFSGVDVDESDIIREGSRRRSTSSRKTAVDQSDKPCATCGRPVGWLEVFPNFGGDGILCIDCYSGTPEGRRMPTGDELVEMWGGTPRRASRKTASHYQPYANGFGVFHVTLPHPNDEEALSLINEALGERGYGFVESVDGTDNGDGTWTYAEGGDDEGDVAWRDDMLQYTHGGRRPHRLTAAEGQTCSVCGDKIAKDPEGGGYHHDNGEKHDHEAKAGKESSRKTAAPTDGERSYCRICGIELQGMDYAWYALKSSSPKRDVGQHHHLPARNADWPGEFNAQGDLVPGTPGGGGGQYDAPAGTIYDAGGKPISIASRKTAGNVPGLKPGDKVTYLKFQNGGTALVPGVVAEVTTAHEVDTPSGANRFRAGTVTLENGDTVQNTTDFILKEGSRKTAAKMIFDEWYGEISYAQRAAYRKHNVSPADHDQLVDLVGNDHAAIVKAVKAFSPNGMFSSWELAGALRDYDWDLDAAIKDEWGYRTGSRKAASRKTANEDFSWLRQGGGRNPFVRSPRRAQATVGEPCPSCEGKGYYRTPMGSDWDDPYGEQMMEVTCSTCGGSGVVNEPTDYPLADDPIFTDRYSSRKVAAAPANAWAYVEGYEEQEKVNGTGRSLGNPYLDGTDAALAYRDGKADARVSNPPRWTRADVEDDDEDFGWFPGSDRDPSEMLTGSRRKQASARVASRKVGSTEWVHVNAGSEGAVRDIYEKVLPGGDHLEVSVNHGSGRASWHYVSREGYFTGGSGTEATLEAAKAAAEASLGSANAGHGPHRGSRRTATTQDVLDAIQSKDPDGFQGREPRDADYESFERWVKANYGEQAWKDYQRGGWADNYGDGKTTASNLENEEDMWGAINQQQRSTERTQKSRLCPDCDGTGATGSGDRCPTCDGSGVRLRQARRQATPAELAPRIRVPERDKAVLSAFTALHSMSSKVGGIDGKAIVRHLLTVGQMDESTRAQMGALLNGRAGK